MASRSTEEEELKKKTPSSQSTESLLTFDDEDDDDFQDPATHPLHLTQTTLLGRSRGRSSSCCSRISFSQPLKPSNSAVSRPPKKPKRHAGKENLDTGGTPLLSLSNTPPLFRMSSNPPSTINTRQQVDALAPDLDLDCSLDVIKSTIDSSYRVAVDASAHAPAPACNSTIVTSTNKPENMALYPKGGFSYSSNSIESRLLRSRVNCAPNVCVNDGGKNQREEFEPGPKLDVLLKLCTEEDQHPIAAEFLHCKENGSDGGLICCPMCGVDISSLTHEMRQVHTNECLDEEETPDNVVLPDVDAGLQYPRQVLDASPARSPRQAFEVCPVREWLCSLGLARYAEIFVKEEVDWDTLQWLTEETFHNLK
ncbi:hypothetical protein RJ639_036142 [Escallonia herrerae]|uniref:SAM domain-containing protein n=1 Tax=Escallonia herrerae TaxID=1293975 RepID=A0AA88WRG1_9ASTE|nr:hypothetical protein RJ639_036142 [Escallonia herrerae]